MQKEELVKKIDEYAERCALLTPRHVVEHAEAVYGGELGVNLGLAVHPTTSRYHTFTFFLLQKTRTSTSKHSKDAQSLLPII